MLIAPCVAQRRIGAGRMRPYAATTTTSAPSVLNRASTSGARRVCGCSTRSLCRSASCLTGLGVPRMPRPEGRSGCVRTRAISCPASTSRARARCAKIGVPAKIRRRNAERSGGLAQLLGELCADALLLQLREVLDEDLALQVIHLVLD